MATKKEKGKKNVVKEVAHIGLVQNDPWLEPYEEAIRGRHDHALWKLSLPGTLGARRPSSRPPFSGTYLGAPLSFCIAAILHSRLRASSSRGPFFRASDRLGDRKSVV